MYLRPGTAGGAIHPNDTSQHLGDSWLISVSSLTPAPVATPSALTFNNPGGTNSSNISAGFAGSDSQPGTLTSLTLTTFPTNATSITINGTKYTGAAAFNAASVAARTLTTNGDGTLATGQTVAVDPVDGGVTSVLPFTVTDAQGSTSAAANLNITFTATSSGYVFEDVNYGGGAGRPISAAGTSPRSGATVELYNTSTGAFVASTTTDVNGKYSFNTLANTGYTVRVVNSTVTSSRNSNNVAGLVPVQTYNGTTSRVGGENPTLVDALANTTGLALSALTPLNGSTTPESLAAFNTNANISPDFGFNFDTVVNTNDVATVNGNNAQGSLRQFLLNSNALTGEAALAQVYTPTTGAATALTPAVETSIFMIPNGAAIAGQQAGLASGFTTSGTGSGSGTSATITLKAALPNITGAFTSLDGGTQTNSTGDTNAPVTTTGSESLGNEVVLNFGNFNGLSTSAASTSLLNLSLTNANNAGGSTTAAFSILAGATSAVVQNNTFYKSGANLRINGVGGATISNNISRDALSAESDGIEVTGSSNNTIAGNQFLNNAGFGIDFISGTSMGNAITGNTFSRNGQNSVNNYQTAGIGFRSANSSNNTVSNNTFTNNVGDGISATQGTNNIFSQNSFSNNGDLAIDLAAGGNGNSDGVTVNTGTTRTGANNLINFPVLTTATVNADNLVINGFTRPGNLVELYLAAPDPSGFGEGATYLTNFTQGTAVGTTGNVITRTATPYGPGNINGLNQGTDNTFGFTVTIPLSSLTAAQKTALQSGSAVLTSTATLSGTGTSEFSGNLALPIADATVSLSGPTTLVAGQATGTYTATFTNEGPASASDIARSVTLPVGASLSAAQRSDLITRYSAAFSTDPVTNATVINFGTVALAKNASSLVTFAFTAPNTASTTLALTANTSSASQGANSAPDQATLTLSTVTTADVAATITAAATATTQTFTVRFSNNGSQDAASIVRSVQLPAGLTAASITYTGDAVGASYNTTTGVVTYPATPTTLAAGTPLTSTISYPVAGSPVAPLTATASISTTTNEAGLTANNSASAIMPTQFDLTTTLSGPATAVAGSPIMLYVTTTNLGPNTAPVATQTVTIPSATTLAGSIYITNGGSYSFSSNVGTVTFPTLSNLPTGQTITNSISFLAPAANFAPSATVTTTAATELNTANNAANLNGGATGATVTVNSTITAFSNESTTIQATITTGGTTTPATVVDVNTPITYTVKSFNKGYSAATVSATVIEQVQLLPGLTTTTLKVGSATPTTLGNGNFSYANTAGTTTYNPTSGLLTYYSVTQAAGDSTTYDAIVVTVPTAVGNGGQLLATASVQTTNFVDPVPADNVASVAVRVRTKPDLATSISGPSSTAAGLTASYVVRFTNSGTNDATTVTETVQLLPGLSGVTIADANGNAVGGATYDGVTGLVTFPGLVIDAVGATQVYTIGLTAPAQSFPVTSTIAGLTSDGVANNNSATQRTTVTANADLAVNITGPATAVIGNPVTYVVTTTNNGPTTATNVVPTLQLPKNLSGVDIGTGSATYNPSTGLLTFATKTTLTPSGSTVNYITFTMPNATASGDAAVSNGLIVATAAVSSSSTDLVAANNTAALTTSIIPATTDVADLITSFSRTDGSGATVPAGTQLTYTAAYRNAGSSAASNVVGTVNLPSGLSVNDLVLNGTGGGSGTGVKGTLTGNIITFGGTTNGLPAGATYNQTTGLLTFPTFATLPVSSSSNGYSISFPAPANDVLAISEITSATSDNGPLVNRSNSFTTVSSNVDVAAALSGPTTAQPGTTVSYTATTVNNGPSLNPNSTTQVVNLPVGAVLVPGSYPNGAYSSTNNTLTWSIPSGQAPGAANAVVNTFSLVMPATGNIALSTTITSAGENATNPVTGANNSTNNTATLTTIPANQAPVAENIWNTLRGARANNAIALPISPLVATDVDGSIATYMVTKAPTQGGTLYYNGTAVADNTTVTAAGLSFIPTPNFVGNVTFSYVATDDGGAASPPALYTIPVAQDKAASYATYNSGKGGANKYLVNDVLAAVVDPNTATYIATGTVYTTTGTLQAGAANGLRLGGTNAVLAGTGPTGNTANTLPAGVSLNAITGQLYVSDVSASGLVNNSTARAYSVNITTTDINGGISTQTVTFTIGAYPLPVVLTVFTAQAVQNRDAILNWATASEQNSASFEIERSLDSSKFTKIGQVAAQGTSSSAIAYTFTDASIGARAQGSVYYRLRQVDLNGDAYYSPVRTVSFTKATAVALSIYPNPAANSTTLDLSSLPASASYQVVLLDATGRQVLVTTHTGGSSQLLDLTFLASGTYNVLVTGTLADGSTLRQVLRLTKE
ncbi:right-handed parallel beta-helix repeat-containing protein [Hymenobacter sp. UV11]|uniref:right-handed parallel beta-helix repeat-containing protein n=1 Tax=Hymenobacter sp. UV11 TaxID=1849735 RepID=UPI0010DBB6D9|nr:right-handed parallel beta-helix repeat-containing protein [Hymenobacter sp. UV11]TDN38953.1 hypothetical protein A8B98_20850 [Hymenobacter sp. UV11]